MKVVWYVRTCCIHHNRVVRALTTNDADDDADADPHTHSPLDFLEYGFHLFVDG